MKPAITWAVYWGGFECKNKVFCVNLRLTVIGLID